MHQAEGLLPVPVELGPHFIHGSKTILGVSISTQMRLNQHFPFFTCNKVVTNCASKAVHRRFSQYHEV